jgi:hypothetical protein
MGRRVIHDKDSQEMKRGVMVFRRNGVKRLTIISCLPGDIQWGTVPDDSIIEGSA